MITRYFIYWTKGFYKAIKLHNGDIFNKVHMAMYVDRRKVITVKLTTRTDRQNHAGSLIWIHLKRALIYMCAKCLKILQTERQTDNKPTPQTELQVQAESEYIMPLVFEFRRHKKLSRLETEFVTFTKIWSVIRNAGFRQILSITLKLIRKFDLQDFDRNAFLQSNREVYWNAGLSFRFHDAFKKKLVFITKGISIIFVHLILKNLRKCTHKTYTVYLEFERNSLVFEVSLMPITVNTLEFCCKKRWVLMYVRMQ